MQKVDKSKFFEVPKNWENDWQDMPSFKQTNLKPFQSVKIHFRSLIDRNKFSELIEQNISNKTKYLWFPKIEKKEIVPVSLTESNALNPKYPIYIISKGRWDTRLTVKALEKLNVPYHVVIEPQEYDKYSSVINAKNILTLPFSNLGKGSIPARNWVWEHSISIGAERHWILDDNISGFGLVINGKRIKTTDKSFFYYCELFVDRYKNIALAGLQYRFFIPYNRPPFLRNTRIYSCILINNKIPYRWRGKYNEDTDLSLRALKDDWCTVLFNWCYCDKQATMTMKGGNTDELYKKDGRLIMAQSLQKQHPDVVRVTKKWGRYQHHVNYSRFKNNKFILKSSESKGQSSNYFDDIVNKLYKNIK